MLRRGNKGSKLQVRRDDLKRVPKTEFKDLVQGSWPMLGADEMAEYFELMEKTKRKEKEKKELR